MSASKPLKKKLENFLVPSPPAKSDKKRILVFGTFDIIHPLHLQFLVEARNIVNCNNCELVVVLSRDSSILRIKGHEPIFNEKIRLRFVCSLRMVDFARLGNEGINYFDVILEVNPDFIVLGYDQALNEAPLHAFIHANTLNIQIFRLPKYESGDLSSSSEVREKVLELVNEKKKKKRKN